MLEKSKVKGPRPRRREALRSGPGVTARVPPLRAVGWSSVRRDRGLRADEADAVGGRDGLAAADHLGAPIHVDRLTAVIDLDVGVGQGGLGLVSVGVVAHGPDLDGLHGGLLGGGGVGDGGDDEQGADGTDHDSLSRVRVWGAIQVRKRVRATRLS